MCAKAMEYRPDLVDLAVTRLTCLFHLDKLAVGSKLAKKMLKQFPRDPYISYWAGMINKDNDPQSALASFQISNKFMPRRSETYPKKLEKGMKKVQT